MQLADAGNLDRFDDEFVFAALRGVDSYGTVRDRFGAIPRVRGNPCRVARPGDAFDGGRSSLRSKPRCPLPNSRRPETSPSMRDSLQLRHPGRSTSPFGQRTCRPSERDKPVRFRPSSPFGRRSRRGLRVCVGRSRGIGRRIGRRRGRLRRRRLGRDRRFRRIRRQRSVRRQRRVRHRVLGGVGGVGSAAWRSRFGSLQIIFVTAAASGDFGDLVGRKREIVFAACPRARLS